MNLSIQHKALAVIGSTSALLLAQQAAAQDVPAGLATQAPATSGSTDVAAEGFQQAAEVPEELTDATEATLSAGALFASGNANSIAVTGLGQLRIRRAHHQVGAELAVNQTHSDNPESSGIDYEPTVDNYQGRVRYDYFVAEHFSTFLQVTGRQDQFQGLILRLNIDPGLAYYFIDSTRQQLWGELGYDFQYDSRYDAYLNQAEADTDVRPDKTASRHFARGFVGYANSLSESVNFRTTLELLQGLAPFRDEDTDNVNLRLNWDGALTAKVSDKFSIATTVQVKYDNNPFSETIKNTDVTSAVNLVYSLM